MRYAHSLSIDCVTKPCNREQIKKLLNAISMSMSQIWLQFDEEVTSGDILGFSFSSYETHQQDFEKRFIAFMEGETRVSIPESM